MENWRYDSRFVGHLNDRPAFVANCCEGSEGGTAPDPSEGDDCPDEDDCPPNYIDEEDGGGGGVVAPCSLFPSPFTIATAIITNKTGYANGENAGSPGCMPDSAACNLAEGVVGPPVRFTTAASTGGGPLCENAVTFPLTCVGGFMVLGNGSGGTATLVSFNAALKILVFDVNCGALGTPPPTTGSFRVTITLA